MTGGWGVSASSRIGGDLALIRSEAFTERCRTTPESFTRRRKMPADVLVESVIARKGRTLKMEMREFARERRLGSTISVPGYLKQREKLNPLALLDLARNHAASVYADGAYRTYAGMLVLAVDGSTANVPTNPETIERYGDSSGHGASQATMGLSAAFDVLNRQIVSLTVNRGGFDERAQVPEHLSSLPEVIGEAPFMLVMDRGYPSFALMADLSDAGVPYVMRCQSNFMNAEFKAAARAGGDAELEVALDYPRIAWAREHDPAAYERLRAHAPLPVRCALVDIGTGEREKIVTNIPAGILPPGSLKEVYHLRWGVETCFQMLKDRLQMENLTGTKPVLIEQDVYASAYLLNVAFDMANEADLKAAGDAGSRGWAHEMTVNRSFAIGVLKDELIRLVMADDSEREAMMAGIVDEISRCLVPVRRDRSYPRDMVKTRRANRYSNTHKRVF